MYLTFLISNNSIRLTACNNTNYLKKKVLYRAGTEIFLCHRISPMIEQPHPMYNVRRQLNVLLRRPVELNIRHVHISASTWMWRQTRIPRTAKPRWRHAEVRATSASQRRMRANRDCHVVGLPFLISGNARHRT